MNFLTRGQSCYIRFFFCNVKDAYTCVQQAPIGRSDHIMLQLLPKYLPVLKRSKPNKKCVRVLDESGLSALQGCFDFTVWSVFVQSCENVDQLNDCITDYIHFCVDIQTREKNLLCYPNKKPWKTKGLKKTINEKKFLFALKLKQKELRKEL